MTHNWTDYKNRGREEELRSLLRQRLFIVDGAMGTMIQAENLNAQDFGGHAFEGCNEHLNLTRPDVIAKIHQAYLEAGADIIETNSFGANRLVLAEYGLADKTLEINRKAAQIARESVAKFSYSPSLRRSASPPLRHCFIAGSMGPTTKSLMVTGGATFGRLEEAYAEQAQGLMEGGADILLIETAQDALNLKAALCGLDRAFELLGRTAAVMVSATIEKTGTMFAGSTIEALYAALEHRNLLSIGLNCATGPDFMADHARTLSEISRFAVSCLPNAGLPDENGRYSETPEIFARKLERFVMEGWVNILGGCCGTTPQHIRKLAEMARGRMPRPVLSHKKSHISGLESLELTDERRPVLVGERTNVIGSRIFKDLISLEKWDEAVEVGQRQIRNGAQVIDVCLANPDRDEKTDMETFLAALVNKIKAPVMIDSTDPAVVEAALRLAPGKCIINSVNFEDGGKRLEKTALLVKRYGAALVFGTIDDDRDEPMALKAGRKLAVAQRAYKLLTEKYGLSPQDIIFDPLTFPCAAADKKGAGLAKETIEGVRLIKEALPQSKTILGISNVSFGLPPAGREVVNAVFIHHAVAAGLDLAIVNAEKLARYYLLSEKEKDLAGRILFAEDPPIAEFVSYFRGRPEIEEDDAVKNLTAEEHLVFCVKHGLKKNLPQILDELRSRLEPFEIINGLLMNAMEEVGRLFAANEMIIAEVLQSAEVVKAAAVYLEPFMEKAGIKSSAGGGSAFGGKGAVILATVKGDVHDIGKNLVHMILRNNGFRVVDLGIKVTSEQLLEAVVREKPLLIGLSGLLVKSVQQMISTAEDLSAQGIDAPMLVGGAALSAKFTARRLAPRYRGPVVYCKDAMAGLNAAASLADLSRRPAFLAKNKESQEFLACQTVPEAESTGPRAGRAAVIAHQPDAPVAPDLELHVEKEFNTAKIFEYLNANMLYGKHFGLRGHFETLLSQGDPKAVELKKRIEEIKGEILAKKIIKARGLWRFFPCYSEGDTLHIFSSLPSPLEAAMASGHISALEALRSGGEGRVRGSFRVLKSFIFPRQSGGERLCLADFVRPMCLPPSAPPLRRSAAPPFHCDYLALFVVTCGEGILQESERLRESGDYFKSHALAALAIECAEASAELLHEKLRGLWGFADPPAMTLLEKFQAKYRGKRYSFGYPACPNLEDQKKLFELLEPEKHIGVKLTENFMMDPEASVSALVFHHPQAKYFSAAPAA